MIERIKINVGSLCIFFNHFILLIVFVSNLVFMPKINFPYQKLLIWFISVCVCVCARVIVMILGETAGITTIIIMKCVHFQGRQRRLRLLLLVLLLLMRLHIAICF